MKEEKQRKDLFQMVLGLLPQNLARAADTLTKEKGLPAKNCVCGPDSPFWPGQKEGGSHCPGAESRQR